MTDQKPSKEFQSRYDVAKRWRDIVRPDIEEALSFICPGREDDFSDRNGEPQDDEREVLIDLSAELATDFASDLVNYFCPSETTWTELVAESVPEDISDQAEALLNKREKDVFGMIRASNFNDMAPQIMFEANHGTVAMWAVKPSTTRPVYVEAVTPDELLICPGQFGVLDRFREQNIPTSHLENLLAEYEGAKLPDEIKRKAEKPGSKSKLCWGFWVDWSDVGNPLWRCEIVVDGKRCTPAQPLTIGPLAGGCPLLVGRFNPIPKRPWGRGPAIMALPSLRVYNAVDEAVVTGLEQSIYNTLIYPDDGVLDLSEGLEVGTANPAGPAFDRNQIWEAARGVDLDYGFISEERIQDRLRALFYQNGPRQRGDTPPSATQWMDERHNIHRRLGKPSAPLHTEFFYPFFQRIEFLGVQEGRIDAQITIDQNIITATPISPLQKAADQEKVMKARSNLELGAGVFGEAMPQIVDATTTYKNIVRASGDELTVIKEEQDEPAPPAQ